MKSSKVLVNIDGYIYCPYHDTNLWSILNKIHIWGFKLVQHQALTSIEIVF